MASTAAPRPRPRPAHTEGSTYCAYTPDGTRLVTVGSNNTIRMYKTGFDGEPANIDDCQEQNTCVAASNDFFVVGSEDGTVSLYSIPNASFEKFLFRSSLPVRAVALSPDGQWCAVASDELSVKVVSTGTELADTRLLKEHNKPTKHLAFDGKGQTVSLSCTDGVIYVYTLTTDEPELLRKIDGVIGAWESDSEISSAVAWHPDGRAFAAPTATREIQVVSKNDWENQRAFVKGHSGDVTALAWSPNGALLASAGKDRRILLWETKTQSVIHRLDYANVMAISWHPTQNLAAFANSDGEVYIHTDFVPEQHAPLLKLPKQPAPFIHDPLQEISANGAQQGLKLADRPRPRRDSLESYDSLMDGPRPEQDDMDFIEDDDGAGYVVNGNGKRARARAGDDKSESRIKRQHLEAQYHESFQPGSTPWRGNRKYLCLNLIGFVWTVDQDGHNTVTVEFYDHDFHRDFHFTDTFLYDKACLNDNGSLFSCPPQADVPATVFYRPHETWTNRSDWRTQLPKGEAVLAMSLSDSFVTVTTSANYVRVYTLFGIPYRVYRPKSTPMVTCASWRDYVLTMGNGPVGADGVARLLYSIENIKKDEICQNEDTVALPEGATVKSVFFSDSGDPCIYDSTGTLLTLLHWRQPSRASWLPLLDTNLLPRLASGRKHETYFPIAVADGKFHCIILKGGDLYPYFPRPLLSEFDFSVPLTAKPERVRGGKDRDGDEDMGDDGDDDVGGDDDDDDDDDGAGGNGSKETRKLEQTYLLKGIAAAQLSDLLDSSEAAALASAGAGSASRSALARLELDIDKTLLQYLAVECRNGEERGMRALELVRLMRDRTGRMMEAAGKVAERYGRGVLGEKIRELGDRVVGGQEEF